VQFIQEHKGATLEAVVYPILLTALIWSVFLFERFSGIELYRWGVLPQTWEGFKGIVLMPLIHGQKDFSHIINNSLPLLVLLATLIYFYRKIALYVVLFIWLGSGFLLWFIAENTGSYHIGMSGVIYGLFGFLFVSGFFRKYMPLKALSMFVVFLYGSLIWGVFPGEAGISWEGHLFGFAIGIVLAYAFRKEGPVPPKYRYEIEQEMGIEPPDLEAIWWENQRRIIGLQRERERMEQETINQPIIREENSDATNDTINSTQPGSSIHYTFRRKTKED
jgi:membrane associated rhomboid family serine protease